MQILIVGPWEDWVSTDTAAIDIRRACNAVEGLELLASWRPQLAIIDPSLVGASRESLISLAESLGIRVIAAGAQAVQIPGSSLEEIEKHAILETLKSVGGSTSRAAKVLGISVRKIQYRLRDWRSEKQAQEEARRPSSAHH